MGGAWRKKQLRKLVSGFFAFWTFLHPENLGWENNLTFQFQRVAGWFKTIMFLPWFPDILKKLFSFTWHWYYWMESAWTTQSYSLFHWDRGAVQGAEAHFQASLCNTIHLLSLFSISLLFSLSGQNWSGLKGNDRTEKAHSLLTLTKKQHYHGPCWWARCDLQTTRILSVLSVLFPQWKQQHGLQVKWDNNSSSTQKAPNKPSPLGKLYYY